MDAQAVWAYSILLSGPIVNHSERATPSSRSRAHGFICFSGLQLQLLEIPP